MKKLTRIFLLAAMIFALFGTTGAFAGSIPIQITLDGKEIVTDSPPVIVDGRTLIPVRALFEAMNGSVSWNEASREVDAVVGEVTIQLKIDSTTAYINGTAQTLDVPAQIIKNRTMIPVRFVTESAGCEVSWDEKNRIVSVVSPGQENPEPPEINIGTISRKGDGIRIEADGEISDYTSFKMYSPSRFVVDIKNAKLTGKDGSLGIADNPYFKAVRYSQYTDDTVRVVADLMPYTDGSVSRSDSNRTAQVRFEVNVPDEAENIIEPDGSISSADRAVLDQYGLEPVKAEAQQKLVVIDAGHGGKDTGSRGYENGIAVLDEKDINLDVALRIQEMLEAAGVRLYMIRTGDVTVALYDRQDTANLLEASVYVAIHNNSYTSSVPTGTEVHYRSKEDPPVDGISAMELAKNLQNELTANLGLANRGTKVSPELAVLRRTEMPAVIIEGAFISNPNDLNAMKTDEFREKYAAATAKCIIEALNNSVE